MRNRFGMRFVLSAIVVAIGISVVPSVAAADWSQVEPAPGFSGSRPYDLTELEADDGSKFRYWTRDVGGFETVQGMWVAANGTPGAIVNISDPLSDFGTELQGVIAADGEVTLAWVAPAIPNPVVKSVDIAPSGAPGAVTTRSPAGGINEGVDQLSIAVSPNGTVAYVWRRAIGAIFRPQGVTVPDNGPAGTVRFYSDAPLSAITPAVAGLVDDKFKLAWIVFNSSTGFWNLLSTDLANDGSTVTPEPNFLFPEVDAVGEPSGATGNPGGLRMGTNSSGAGILVWRQFTTRTELIDGQLVTVGLQWSAESSRFLTGGIPGTIQSLSPNGANISNINLQMTPDLRNTVTWLSEAGGVARTQLFRFSGEGIWNLSTGPDFTDPNVSMSENGSMLVGWTEEGLLPGDAVAKVSAISRGGSILSQTLPGLDALNLSAEPLPDVGEQGLSSVVFYGEDGVNDGFWKSAFTDPGIDINPPKVFFGTGLLNVNNGVQRLFLSNTGTTPTDVTSLGLSGSGQDSFSIVNPGDCAGSIAPSASCEVRITFSPDQAGSKQAVFEAQTDAGNVSSEVSGRAVARTRVNLKVRPRIRVVKAGKPARFRAVVRNTGGIAARNVRVCFNGPRRIITPRKKCLRIKSLGAGNRRSLNFRTRVSGRTKAGSQHKVMFRLKAGNAKSRRGPATIRAKRTSR